MALLSYSKDIVKETGLVGDSALLKARVKDLQPNAGKPHTGLALQEMRDVMARQARPGAPQVSKASGSVSVQDGVVALGPPSVA